MPENKHLRLLLVLLYIALGALGLWLTARFLVPWLLPFLIAWALAALLEPPVCLCMDGLHLPRWAAAALCTLLLTALILGLLFLGAWRVGYEVAVLLRRLPVLLSGLPALSDWLEKAVYRLVVAAPVSLQDWLRQALEGLVSQGVGLPSQFYDWLLAAVTGAASALPNLALFLFTAVLATYFTSARRPALLVFLRRQVPRPWLARFRGAGRRLKSTLGGWLRAQGLLMLITFGQVAAGLLLLRVDLALLLAAAIALVDALPIFGTGTVLIPWAVLELLAGNLRLALGLLALYLVVWLVRSLLEPRLLGARAGLPPLPALMAMYVGFRAFGVAGMVLAPLVLLLLKELHDAGFLRLWRD